MKKSFLAIFLLILAIPVFSQTTWENENVTVEIPVYCPPLLHPTVSFKIDYDYTVYPNGVEGVSNIFIDNYSFASSYGTVNAWLQYGIEYDNYIMFAISGSISISGTSHSFYGQLLYRGKREPYATELEGGGGGPDPIDNTY